MFPMTRSKGLAARLICITRNLVKLIDTAYEQYIRLNQTNAKTTSGKVTALGLGLLTAYGYIKDGYELATYVRSGVSDLSMALSQKRPLIQDRIILLNESQLLSFSYSPISLTTEGTSVFYSAVTASTSTTATFSQTI